MVASQRFPGGASAPPLLSLKVRSNARIAIRSLVLILACGVAGCWGYVEDAAAAQGGNRLTRLILLPNNSFGAKCLDGSPPGYYVRPGAGAGLRKWVLHLRGGAWCTSPLSCAWRARGNLGSSRAWPRSPQDPRIPSEMGGILSADPRENPGLAAWNLAVLNYCDGGGYAGTAGRKLVAGVPAAWFGGVVRSVSDGMEGSGGSRNNKSRRGAFYPSKLQKSSSSSSNQQRDFLLYRRIDSSSSETDSSSSSSSSSSSGSRSGGRSSSGASMSSVINPAAGGGQSAGGYGVGTVTKELYLDGYNIVSAFMADLVRKRGMGAATHVLVTGCSAGAEAVMAVCDRFKRLLPQASVKCLMDGGMFVDARGREGRRPMRSRVQRVVALHAMHLNSNCMADFLPRTRWRCFFPQHALSRMVAPVFLVNSLFDQVALALGGQLDSLNRTHTSSCIWGILRARRDLQRMVLSKGWVRRRFWARGAAQQCGVREEAAVVSAAFDTFKYVRDVVEERRDFGAFILARRPWHCSTTSFLWTTATANGVKLNQAVLNWIMGRGNKNFYI
ncbi:hypothetical protein CLOP_g21522 [Closterium sp. NIES-67]|nr:hypothetical protein CLOP_g21522 [Closterium sp. NIES-67]